MAGIKLELPSDWEQNLDRAFEMEERYAAVCLGADTDTLCAAQR
jgi:hypothetical protein